MATNPYVNKVQTADGTTIMDITDTTAQAGDVREGEVFYTQSGQRSVGTLTLLGFYIDSSGYVCQDINPSS